MSTAAIIDQRQRISISNVSSAGSSSSLIEAKDGLGGSNIIRIQNVSCTVNFGIELDLKKIALKCRNTEFNPRRSAAIVMKLREGGATAIIFPSGKVCLNGTKSIHDVTIAIKRLSRVIELTTTTLNKLSPEEQQQQSSPEYNIQNIVGSTNVGFQIRLEGLVYAHSVYASFEPELFPGLIYRMDKPRVDFLIFLSGKIVITGARTEEDLKQAYTKIYPILHDFKYLSAK
mmetsp:Transcript_37023/g.42234  ORF Transcript_37023/g.42234 Transcript_37023/m.42234 type:complete len:230 (-) Transcript_37023:261-950(-)